MASEEGVAFDGRDGQSNRFSLQAAAVSAVIDCGEAAASADYCEPRN